MKPYLLAVTAILALISTSEASASTVLFDGFESYSPGALSGQGGWVGTGIGGTSQVSVSSAQSFYGAQSVYVYDGDTSNRPKARFDYGSNTATGEIDFAVMEDPGTAGRDLWRVDFYNTSSSGVNFSLVMSSTSVLSLSNGTTTLATFNPSAVTSTYDPSGWNEFSIVFDNVGKTAAVYMNEDPNPVLTSTDAGTTWQIGRMELSVGSTAATGQGVFFDNNPGGAQWQTTNLLRYSPPNLVAPLTISVPVGYYNGTLDNNDDVILALPTTRARSSSLTVTGGRNIRLIGGDMGNNNLAIRQVQKSAFVEGIKMNLSSALTSTNGCLVDVSGTREFDGVDVTGVATGSTAAPDIYIQNCNIIGLHGTHLAHTAGVLALTGTCTALTSGTHVTADIKTSAAHGLVAGQSFIYGPSTIPALNDTYTVQTVASTTEVTATRVATWLPLHGSLTVGQVGTGGYIWGLSTTNALGNHADCYQCQSGLQNVIHFYKATLESNYQCFIGYHTATDDLARGLEMTRVNMRQNTIWPQDYNSPALYLGSTDGTGSGNQGYFQVDFDRVYLQPRIAFSISNEVVPGPAPATQGGVDVSAYFVDAPTNQNLTWHQNPAGLDVEGNLTDSTANGGYPSEAGFTTVNYADLTAAHPPGYSYQSPGYSGAGPLKLNGVSLANYDGSTGTTITRAVGSAGTGVLITRPDVATTGKGYIINLGFATGGNPTGFFTFDPAHPRNLITTQQLAVGTYNLVLQASENGNSANFITKSITVVVTP